LLFNLWLFVRCCLVRFFAFWLIVIIAQFFIVFSNWLIFSKASKIVLCFTAWEVVAAHYAVF
jgi:hypothetical protein